MDFSNNFLYYTKLTTSKAVIEIAEGNYRREIAFEIIECIELEIHESFFIFHTILDSWVDEAHPTHVTECFEQKKMAGSLPFESLAFTVIIIT